MVGVVLGAGPLQGRLGDQLNQEVSGLRKTKTDLSAQLLQSRADVTNRDKFFAAITPQLVESRLSGRSIVMVTLPGADGDVVKSVDAVLATAGARLNGTIKITGVWTDPAKKAFRDTLAQSLAPLDPTSLPAGASQDQQLAAILARGLVVSDLTAADKADSGATSALQALKTGGVIDYSGAGPLPSSLAVVVAGAPTVKETSAQQEAEATSYAVLARALDAASSGAVAISGPDAAAAGGTLHALRADKQAAAAVSTVDDADEAIGVVTVVMALREQAAGGAGQYGFADGADKVAPSDTTP